MVLTEDGLIRAKGDMQAVVDCVPAGNILDIAVPSITPTDTIVLQRPMRIRSFSGTKVEFKCPPGGLLDIRYANGCSDAMFQCMAAARMVCMQLLHKMCEK